MLLSERIAVPERKAIDVVRGLSMGECGLKKGEQVVPVFYLMVRDVLT
jgi:hypothetical protein